VATFLRGTMPFFEPEQPFYTYSIDIATLWGGLWYLFFEIQHDEHGQMCISGCLYGNRCESGPRLCKLQCTAQACSHPTFAHSMLAYSKRSHFWSRACPRTPSRSQMRAVVVKAASDATCTHPSDHNMRGATTALLTVCATLGPRFSMVGEVLRAFRRPARRNA
jgi:hypothetical protein